MICTTCFTRMDACADCHEKYIEAQDIIISGQRKEIEALKVQIAAMRRCEICKHFHNNYHDAPCVSCAHTTELPKWELAK